MEVIQRYRIGESVSRFRILSLCSALAVVSRLDCGLVMGVGTMAALVVSTLILRLLQARLPTRSKAILFVVCVAATTTIINRIVEAFWPQTSAVLGQYSAFMITSALLLSDIEKVHTDTGFGFDPKSATRNGLFFMVSLIPIAAFREYIGAGMILGMRQVGSFVIVPGWWRPCNFVSTTPGAFLILCIVISFLWLLRRDRSTTYN